MPLMPNFWLLVAVYILISAFADINSPLEPLKQEIIPPHERGRATGAMSWCSNFAAMIFFLVIIGRFDDVTYMAGFPIIGEQVIYWSAGMLMMVMLFLVVLGIKETDPKSSLCGQKLSIKTFFGGLMDRELWPVYVLVFGSATLTSGLGPLGNLLYTDQWGYNIQDLGINIAVGATINVFAIGLLTYFADRLNRMRAYRFLICLSVLINALYYCYINYVLPDRRPTLIEIIFFGETGSIIGLLTVMIYIPLVYDYVTRNKMGTYGAGANVVSKVTSLVTLNGVGLFIWGYATLFQPPAGEMTRVVLSNEKPKEAIRSIVSGATWVYPQDGVSTTAESVHFDAWQADGTRTDSGRCWEFRLRNKDSERLATQKEQFEKEKSSLVSAEKMLCDQMAILVRRGDSNAASGAGLDNGKNKSRIAEISDQISRIDADRSDRARKFQKEVTLALGDQLMVDGEQVLGARLTPALGVELSTAERPDTHMLERMLGDLRREYPGVIDLRPLKRESGYGVAISTLVGSGVDENVFVSILQSAVERIAAKWEPGLFVAGRASIGFSHQQALMMDLMVIEEPLIRYVSPVTRVVNGILALFDRAPTPDRKLTALARSLRDPAGISHIRILPVPDARGISITAVLPPGERTAASVDDPVGRRLLGLLGTKEAEGAVPQARAFYNRIETTAATQRLTIARPLLTSTYAPMKYDYMSGYIWMFLLGIFGIIITLVFSRLEAKGLIRKRGVEEAQAS